MQDEKWISCETCLGHGILALWEWFMFFSY